MAVIAALAVVAGWNSGGDRWERAATGAGAVIAFAGLVLTLARHERIRAYTELARMTAEALSAWNGLKVATGINQAIEGNIGVARETFLSPSEGAHQNAALELGQLEEALRSVEPLSRPADLAKVDTWLNERYDHVFDLNQEVVKLLHSAGYTGFEKDGQKPREQIVAARADWERTVQTARSQAARWEPVAGMIHAADRLVQYWVVLALNDPRYANQDEAFKAERKRAFEQAEDAVERMGCAVATRRLGQSWWRVVLLRATTGHAGIRSLDAAKDVIP
ncbi:hypothetical protein [Cryptosporangium phraense]|uniref:Uncharacterized protein n=1 Tax=Cryptosporangium phraense TaxID=2593070 RepID=A0A545ANE1_9ACTN|nr:hypothetical protein [Cryptosporangium phraense]TQS42858.1 hypothetical protein FL583_22680 [Cryptosporangium phraense]